MRYNYKDYKDVKISEIENKIPSIIILATNAALTTVENKIPNIGSLVKKKPRLQHKNYWNWKKTYWYDHDKYITLPEFNNLAAGVFTTRIAQVNLVTKTDFYAKPINLNRKINSNKTKHL